jgi:hypothetical protein
MEEMQKRFFAMAVVRPEGRGQAQELEKVKRFTIRNLQ